MASWKTLLGIAENKDSPPQNDAGAYEASAHNHLPPVPVPLRAEPLALPKDQARAMSKEKDFCVQGWNTYGAFENDFAEPVNGTILDKMTGIMWQQDGSKDEMSIESTKRYLEKLNQARFGGYQDWRLPTLEEGLSLLRSFMNSDGLYIGRHFDTRQKWILTSDYTMEPWEIWDVNFLDGHAYCDNPDNIYFVRACRTAR